MKQRRITQAHSYFSHYQVRVHNTKYL